MNKILNEIKKLTLSEQIDIAIDILINTIKSTGMSENEKILLDELNSIKKIIYSPSDYELKDD